MRHIRTGNKAMKLSTMKYTERLKLSIAADMIFIATLVVSALLIVKEKITMNNLGLIIAVFLIVGGACKNGVNAENGAIYGNCRYGKPSGTSCWPLYC